MAAPGRPAQREGLAQENGQRHPLSQGVWREGLEFGHHARRQTHLDSPSPGPGLLGLENDERMSVSATRFFRL